MRWFRFRDDEDRILEAELTVSDRLRAAILSTAFLIAFVVLAVVSTQAFRLAGGPLDFLSRFPYAAALGGFGFIGVYEGLYWYVTGRLLSRGLRVPLPPRVFSASVEVSLPTFLTALLATVTPAEAALNLPTVFLYFPFLALSTLRLDPGIVVYSGALAALEFVGLAGVLLHAGSAESWVAFAPYVSKGVMVAVTGLVLAFVAVQIRSRIVTLLKSREQQARMAAIFGQHVSPAVMEKLLSQKAGLESEVRHVTVLFLDIRNFTTFSESRKPDDVVAYLNTLFAFMVAEVNAHGGIVNKFLGDGFMAIFGAPLDDGQSEMNAVTAAVAISDGLKKALNEGLEATRIGIGIHSGRAVTGNVGSAQRQEYTLIGDVVNLASRIESQTKVSGAEILISKEAWESTRTQGGNPHEGTPLGPVKVKGRETPVELVKIR